MKTTILILLVLFHTACVTKAPFARDEDYRTLKPPQTGFLLAYELKGETHGSCLLLFKETQGKRYTVPLKFVKDFMFVQVPEGQYKLEILNCGDIDWSLRANEISLFRVYSNKISWVAPMRFDFFGSTGVSINYAFKSLGRSTLMDIWNNSTPQFKPYFVSAYNESPITDKKINSTLSGPQMYSRTNSGFNSSEEILQSFDICYTQAMVSTPLFIGQLKLNVSYTDKSSPEIKTTTNENTYSQDFVNCVTSQIKSNASKYSHLKQVVFTF